MDALLRYFELVLRNLQSRPVSEIAAILGKTMASRARRLAALPRLPFDKRRVRGHRTGGGNPRLAVFVCTTPRAREAKLASGLRSSGWRVVLLYVHRPTFDLHPHFDRVERYSNIWQALSLAVRHRPSVCHVFETLAGDLAAAFITHRPAKIVLDVYDVWEGFKVTPAIAPKVALQRWCIENADALCCRDLKPKHLARRWGYLLPRKLLFFPDYCWDDSPIGTPSASLGDGLHVVLAGTFGIEKRGFGDCGLLDIATVLADQRVHFHIYPHSTGIRHKQHEADYVALARSTPYLHLHPSLPMDELVPELAKYDAGLFVTTFLTYGASSERYDPGVLQYQGSARVADYLDAGLAVITNKEMRFAFFMASRYGVAVDGSIGALRSASESFASVTSAARLEKIARGRAAFSVRKHGPRLAAFYEDLQGPQALHPVRQRASVTDFATAS